MASEKLTNKPFETNISGAVIWVQREVAAVWTDYRMNVSDLLAVITSTTQYSIQKTQYLAQSASFTHDANQYDEIDHVNFLVNSGSGTVAIGTTASGTDIMPAITITGTQSFRLDYPFAATQTIYMTLTGSLDIDMNIWYRPNIF
jgi:hypothetical protein